MKVKDAIAFLKTIDENQDVTLVFGENSDSGAPATVAAGFPYKPTPYGPPSWPKYDNDIFMKTLQ